MINKIDIINAFKFRHACKEFDVNKKIPKELLDVITEAAVLSPTSMGVEPWKMLVISTDEAKEKLSKAKMWGAATQLPSCSHFVVLLRATSERVDFSEENQYLKHIFKDVKKFDDDRYKGYLSKASQYLKEDIVDEVLYEKNAVLESWTARQSYIVLGNIMTVAAMLGVDSCPIEGFHNVHVRDILEKDFGVNVKQYKPSVMVALGYRKQDPSYKSSRRDTSEVISYF